jgi:lysophospholipase L1-like esterase
MMRRLGASFLLFALACSRASSQAGEASPTDGGVAPAPIPVEGGTGGGGGGGGGGGDGGGGGGGDANLGPSGPPAIGYIGRFDTRDLAGPKAAWPGSRIVIRFDGTALTVRLDDVLDPSKPGPSEWDATIDGALQPKFALLAGPHDYDVAKGLALGVHVVELYKRTESQLGVTQLLSIDYHGGKLLAPPLPSDRRIEIIGDSAATGFGVDGAGPACPGANDAAKYESFRASWGAKLGGILAADVHGTTYSGKGLVKDIWRPDTQVMPLLVLRANPEDEASLFDLSTWQPHAVVIMIGGNDFDVGLPVDDGPATLQAFTSAYDALVGTLRASYPQANIFLATSPTLSDDQPAGRASRTNVRTAIASVVTARNGAGDARVRAVEPPVATPAETTGCDGHGGSAFHDRVAQDLEAPLRAATGW